MSDPKEVGVTNMGPVPKGMTFLAASKVIPLKHRINPAHRSGRLTVCETMREIWRIADRIGGSDGDDLKALASAGFHYGKCMVRRMEELKRALDGDA